jgi:uncharacterized protein
MARERLMVRFRAGPTWVSGSVKEQPNWDEHAEFVDALIERGTFVMGGPFSDNSGTMILLEGIDADEAARILEEDPFMQNGVFELEEIREWTVFVDELTPTD